MQSDMFLLAERLVVAMERMSQDVNNISAYVYDLSYNMSYFLNEKREKESFPQEPVDERNGLSSSTPQAGQLSSVEREHSWQYEQANENSEPHIADSEQEAVSCGVVESLVEGIKTEPQSEREENSESSDVPYACSNGRNNVRNFPKEKNQQQHIENGAASHTSSSKKALSVDAIRMNNGTHFLEALGSSKCEPVTLENLPGQKPLAGPSCSTSDTTVSQVGSAERYLFVGNGEDQIPDMIVMEDFDQSDSSRGANYKGMSFPRGMQRSALLKGTYEKGMRKSKTKALECPTNQGKHAQNIPSVASLEAHSREGRFKCSHCEKTFQYLAHLRQHTYVHKGEKRFKCSECGKTFCQSGNLTKHMRTHTGERPFRCNQCGKTFMRSDVLLLHVRMHNGVKPFKCTQCGKCFVQRSILTQHMSVHAGEQPCICYNCGKSFKRTRELLEHILTHN